MSPFCSRARLLAGGALAVFAGAALATAAAAQKAPPDFSSNDVGWIAIGGDFAEIPGLGPALMRNDPAHPYVVNGTGGQPSYRIADLSSNQVGWISIGGDIMDVPGARPGIVRVDPAHPYVPNGTGAQPTYRIADLTNPNLKPWVKERMK